MCSAQLHTRNQAVSTTAKPGKPLLIAIPNYDDRIFPRFDQAHTFYFAEIDLQQRRIESLTAHECPTLECDVCDWLQRMGVKGVICSGIHHHHQAKFQHIGIWLEWGRSGEIKSTLQQWLKEQPAMVNKNQQDRFDQLI